MKFFLLCILPFVFYPALCKVERDPVFNPQTLASSPFWNFQVIVREGAGTKILHICDGIVVFEGYILISKTCFMQKPFVIDSQKDCMLLPWKHNVLVGIADLEVDDDINMFKSYPSRPHYFNHEKVKEPNDIGVNFLALFIVHGKQKFTHPVDRIVLPDGTEDFSRYDCVSCGWGLDKQGSQFFRYFQAIRVRILTRHQCSHHLNSFTRPYDDALCALQNDKVTFQGHRGGPLLCKTSGKDRWKLAGLLMMSGQSLSLNHKNTDILVFTKITNEVLRWLKVVKQEHVVWSRH